jgi:hypothetical protein
MKTYSNTSLIRHLVIRQDFAWNGTFGQNPYRFTSLIRAYSEAQRNRKP